jgi:signal transduction histidine kinase
MCAELMLKLGTLSDQHKMLAEQIVSCTVRATEIVTNLFQLMNAQFGSGYPVVPALMDMGFVARQLVEEMRTVFPTRTINLDVSGETIGNWDRARIGQVFSNLIGNAIEHGFSDTPVSVIVKGNEADVTISVHNEGTPIPSATQETIFNPLASYGDKEGEGKSSATHMGLGLFIIKEIVAAHGGTIHVISSEMKGTTFVVHLPRAAGEL